MSYFIALLNEYSLEMLVGVLCVILLVDSLRLAFRKINKYKRIQRIKCSKNIYYFVSTYDINRAAIQLIFIISFVLKRASWIEAGLKINNLLLYKLISTLLFLIVLWYILRFDIIIITDTEIIGNSSFQNDEDVSYSFDDYLTIYLNNFRKYDLILIKKSDIDIVDFMSRYYYKHN